MIGGDVLFNESVGRFDLPGGNEKTLYKSIKEKLYVFPMKRLFIPVMETKQLLVMKKNITLLYSHDDSYMHNFCVYCSDIFMNDFAHRLFIYFTFNPGNNIEIGKGSCFKTVLFKMF